MNDAEAALLAWEMQTGAAAFKLPARRLRRPAPTATLESLHEAPVPLRVVHDGHSIQVDDTVPSSVIHDGVTYDLTQFHFHSPSEHTIGGVSFDAEVHLVHKSKDGKLLVLAVLLKRGARNSVLKALWDTMPTAPTKEPIVVAGQTVDVQALLPRSGRYAHYDGSLTVPPCTENVQWFVALPESTSATELSAAQIAKLRSALGPRSNRPLQPANGRTPTLVTAK